MGFAIVAVAVSAVAGIVAYTRDDGAAPASARGSARTPLVDRRVPASDIVKLREHVEVVVDAGQARGVRVTDAALATALGLQADDLLTSLSGRAVTRKNDVSDIIFTTGSLQVMTIYAEVERGSERVLLRWQLEGDLRDARRDALTRQLAGQGSGAVSIFGSAPGGSGNINPMIDTIEKLSDTYVRVPRTTFLQFLAAPNALMSSARVVPAVKHGQPDGYKLFAIRPDSVFAKLGLHNGDTIHSVNGHELADVDDLLMLFTNMKDDPELRVELTRRGKPVTITVEITK